MFSNTEKKNLDAKKHILQTKTKTKSHENDVNLNTTVVEPIADFRIRNNAKNRKYESLHGYDELIEKNEIEHEQDEYKHDEKSLWEKQREETLERANRDAKNAFRRDEGAWTDNDGYQQVREAPAFREGYNTTLRVLPPQEEHLHNGLQMLKDNNRASSSIVVQARAKDIVTRLLSQRGDIAKIVGLYFMRGLQTGYFGDKPRELDLIGGLREEIELLLRNFEIEENKNNEKEITEIEIQKRREIIANAIGNAFFEIGMTLPAGSRENSKRNDMIAMNIGARMMSDVPGHRIELPQVHESLRKEISIALGRAMLHLKAAANVYASRLGLPVRDALQKDRTLKRALGQMTLQLIENSASKVGTLFKRYAHRRETIIETIGNVVSESIGSSLLPEIIQTPQFRNENINQRQLVPSKPLPPNVKREYPETQKRKNI